MAAERTGFYEAIYKQKKTARFDKLSNAAVRRAIRSDPDAAPELAAAWFRRAKMVVPQGRTYQTRINAVLRSYVDAHREP